MNPSIKRLAEIAEKPERIIIGLMSGTSLDGLDISLCRITGSGKRTSVELTEFTTHTYSADMKKSLETISSKPTVSLEGVCLMHSRLAEVHGEMILEALKKWDYKPEQIDCIASHGQTIYHAPHHQHGQAGVGHTTLQIGDGDHLAMKTGILTISDFRQKHTAAGGEGAPMASLVDSILFGDVKEDRILLNIGGIANFTWLSATKEKSAPIIPLTTDTGPGNTLIDAAMREYFSRNFDRDSEVAKAGTVDQEVLQILREHDYFYKTMPKTTGPEVFNLDWVQNIIAVSNLSMPKPEDLVATLTRFSAETIAETIQQIPGLSADAVVYASGGGVHNPLLMEWLQELLPGLAIRNFNQIGFDPDAKEAVLFAVLANEMLAGEGFLINPGTEEQKKVNFGKISFPV